MNDSDIDMLQIDRDKLVEWEVENEMKINPGKSKTLRFTTARVKDPQFFFWGGGDQRILEASSCK
jgi:hypothetical protein